MLGRTGIAVGAAVLATEYARVRPGWRSLCARMPDRSMRRSDTAPSKSAGSVRAITKKFPSHPTRRMATRRATETRSVPIHVACRTTNAAK
ncbi:hypothetical protein [Bradyrhizobium sp. 191]|uniref:hypothetical protein n=1 Tax=Bradyrhizobium sp. 191 TaxID=2782659 RepID=UPI001FD9884F|nr:hypothetical protein [Bradyrhizobium sp. 191]